MDIDALEAVRRDDWQRLEALLRKRRLSGPESDELERLYRHTAADLSQVRELNGDIDTVKYISTLVQSVRARMTRRSTHVLNDISKFIVADLPAALYIVRWWIVGAYIFSLTVGAAYGFYWYHHPDILRSVLSAEQGAHFANNDFVNYYSENPAALFGTQVWTNNALLAVVCAVTGITGVVPAYLLFQNSASIGQAAALVSYYGSPGLFFSYILPHGFLELSAIYVAAGAGMHLFWSACVPGRQSRVESASRAGRSSLTIGMGLIIILLISGIEEAYLTPSNLPVWAKITIGASTMILLWVYIIVLGRRAVKAGIDGSGRDEVSGYYASVS